MNKHFLKKIRDTIPEPLKYLTAPLFRKKLINNSSFREYYSLLNKRGSLHPEKTDEYQLAKLKEILIHSYENVPYYTDLFDKNAFNPYSFKNFYEMEAIPFLTRELINANYNKLISRKRIRNGFYQGSTGGSSGIPLKFLLDFDSIYTENAFIYHFRSKLGYDFGDKCATFRQTDYGNQLWKFNPIHNEIIFSPFRLSNSTVKLYVDKINRLKPVFLNGYLSSLWFFAKLLEQNKLNIDSHLKGIFLISENVDPDQRKFVEKFFKARSLSFYGHSERCVFAEEVSPGLYQFNPYYGYTEFVPFEDEKKLIVGTGFLNYSMPLIRYKTDDTCQQEGPYFSIEGKRASKKGLIGINNEFLSSTVFDLENPVFKNVINYQFIQREKGKADLNIVVNNNFKNHEIDTIKSEINKHTKGVIEINLKIVEKLILSPRGKYQMYISYLNDYDEVGDYNK